MVDRPIFYFNIDHLYMYWVQIQRRRLILFHIAVFVIIWDVVDRVFMETTKHHAGFSQSLIALSVPSLVDLLFGGEKVGFFECLCVLSQQILLFVV